ncbi:MAG: hypothetical protein ACRC46_01930 [Thermoguttaceae bacterium]
MKSVRIYNKHGVAFSYPTNWVLDEYDVTSEHATIQVTNPDGAFWMLNIYRNDDDNDADAVDAVDARCRESVAAMQAEYDGIEVSPVTRNIGGRVLIGYEMHFFYLDVVCIAEAIAFRENEITYCLFWLSGDVLAVGAVQEQVATTDVFAAITQSFFETSEALVSLA